MVGPGRPAGPRRPDSVVADWGVDCRGAAAVLLGQTSWRRSGRGQRASWLTGTDLFRPCGNGCRSDRGGRNNSNFRRLSTGHSVGIGNAYGGHVGQKSHTGKCRRRNRTTTLSSSARRHTTNESPLSYDLLAPSRSSSHHRRKNYLDLSILILILAAGTILTRIFFATTTTKHSNFPRISNFRIFCGLPFRYHQASY